MSTWSSLSLKLTGSLRLRFLLAVMLWVMLGIGAIWWSATSVFKAHVVQSYHEELDVHVRELGRLTRVTSDGQPELTRPLSDPRYEEPLSGFYWQITSPGKRTLRSASLTHGGLDEHVAHSPEITHELDSGPTGPAITYGFVRPRADGKDIHFVIATDQKELDRLIDSFTYELTIWLVVLAALLLITGVAIIGFGLQPLTHLATAIARLRADKSEALEGKYPSEIAPLVTDLNDYIRQNSDMIARARVQAGNLAHSLRTPLAVVLDEAERLAEIEQSKASARVLIDQAQMMEQQIEYQLARARASGGARTPGTASHFPELILPILNAMRRLHPDKHFTLIGNTKKEIVVPIDPVDLSELISILLDNAGKWAHQAVQIEVKSGRDDLEIEIHDDGGGMTPEQIADAFTIGTRFDSEKPGSGLGLAIAKDISEAIGAQIELRSSGKGLTAQLGFKHLGASSQS